MTRKGVLSGKLSGSSGYEGNDLYEYKVRALGVDDSDGLPRGIHAASVNSEPRSDPETCRESNGELSEQNTPIKSRERTNNVTDSPTVRTGKSYQSMGEILSLMDSGPPLPICGPESSVEKPNSKFAGSNVKWPTFWGRSSARKMPSMESVGSSGEEELVIQRLEITKNELRHRIAKEARGNAILQASLERRKQALHERRLALEQDVQRLQEQLQAERDLRAALEVGLSMSSGQLSSSCGMDSKTRAELEEIALAEADVARLKQKVAELHHQLNQQRQHQFGSLSNVCDRRNLQQDFDSTLAFCNQERKQRNEDGILLPEWNHIKGQIKVGGSNNRHPRKQFTESTNLSGSKSTEVSNSMSLDEFGAVDSSSVPSTSRVAEVMEYPRHQTTASSALVELTTRLDFFKERRSQLMEQLHNLDLNYGVTATSHNYLYRPSSPSWS